MWTQTFRLHTGCNGVWIRVYCSVVSLVARNVPQRTSIIALPLACQNPRMYKHILVAVDELQSKDGFSIGPKLQLQRAQDPPREWSFGFSGIWGQCWQGVLTSEVLIVTTEPGVYFSQISDSRRQWVWSLLSNSSSPQSPGITRFDFV